jgi:hypothetical protein
MAENAGEVKVILAADGTSWSSALDKAQRQLDSLKKSAPGLGQSMRKEMTEARGSIALLGEEIGIRLPRHVRSFLAELPGVASAMSAAFTGVAIIAIGVALFEAGKKVAEFVKKTEEAAKKNEEAWRNLSSGLHITNDQLQVSNDKLAETIAKLGGKPQNGLKLALDEAILSADELGKKIDEDTKKLTEQLNVNRPSLMKQLFGSADTDDIKAKWDDLASKITETRVAGVESIRAAGTNPDDVKKAQDKLDRDLQTLYEEGSKFASAVYKSARTAQDAQWKHAQGIPVAQDLISGFNSQDMTGRIAASAGMMDFFGVQSDYLSGTATARALGKTKDQLEAARDANEALKRLTADRLRAMEDELAQEKMLHSMTLEEERSFWQKRYMAGSNLGDPINDLIARRIAPLNQEILKQDAEQLKKWTVMIEQLEKTKPERFDFGEVPDVFRIPASGAESARQAALHDRPELLRSIAAAQAELNVAEGVESGLLDKSATATIRQMNAVAKLRAELDELYAKQAAVRSLSPQSYTATMNPEFLQNEVIQKQAQLGAATQELQYQTEKDTFGAQMSVMFNDWIRQATDLKGIMGGLFQETMNSVNEGIIKTITTRNNPHLWTDTGKQIATGVARKGLEFGEGSIAKALKLPGVGKLGSSAANAMWTRSADTFKSGSTTLGGLINSSSAGSGASGFGKSILGSLMNMIPFLAGGGYLETNMPAVVGEHGPELFIPSGSGRIVPNDAPMLGTSHTWNIDARGSNDPAAVRAAVQRGIMEAAPHIAVSAIAAQNELRSRMPSMSTMR